MRKMLEIKWNDLPAECARPTKEDKFSTKEYLFLENRGKSLKVMNPIIISLLFFEILLLIYKLK